jgi:hypothetical protein
MGDAFEAPLIFSAMDGRMRDAEIQPSSLQ